MNRTFILAFTVSTILLCFIKSPYCQYNNYLIENNGTYNNDYPVVLLHGLAGWNRDELLGYKYWGGFSDIEHYLRQNTHETYTAAVGPFSSNWDRACELYAYIKGGTVDYGKAHSEKFGHKRFGNTFAGLYPEWGETDPKTGKTNKIHLIAHSMGGQTMRVLIHLLENGSPEEAGITPPDEISSLFTGGKSWVCGAVSISSPHDGATISTIEDNLIISTILNALPAAAAFSNDFLYDFKLDQWGLEKDTDESLYSYIKRMLNNKIWSDTKDIAFWDLSPEGAEELNQWIKPSQNVYYFSFANECTFQEPNSGFHIPEIHMDPRYVPISLVIGSIDDEKWRENDGIVNTVSMKGPKKGSSAEIVTFEGTPGRGIWNYMGKIPDTDHFAIIGHSYFPAQKFYHDIVRMLKKLE